VLPNPDLVLALKANLAVMNSADTQIEILEKAVQDRVKLRPVQVSKDGTRNRAHPGADHHARDWGDREICQCRQLCFVLSVCGSKKICNGKRKGSGNTKNGNKYLAWAFVEAANLRSALVRDQRLLPEKEIQEPRHCGHQSSGAQALPSLLLHYQRLGCV